MTHDDYGTIACPWCGKEMGDPVDCFPGGLWRDGSSVDLDCGGCGEPVAVTMSDGMRMSEPVRFACERRGRRRLSLTQEGWWQEIGDAVPDPVSQGLLRSAVSCFVCNCIWPAVTDREMADLVREVGETIELAGERLLLHKADADREHLMLVRRPTEERLNELRRRLDDVRRRAKHAAGG